ncbi:hypothetical protein CR513_09553, partial [Mucuna pruriens]
MPKKFRMTVVRNRQDEMLVSVHGLQKVESSNMQGPLLSTIYRPSVRKVRREVDNVLLSWWLYQIKLELTIA